MSHILHYPLHSPFGLRVTKMWNDLPDSVVCAPSVKTFEKRLDSYWKNQEIKYDYEADFVYSTNATVDTSGEDILEDY